MEQNTITKAYSTILKREITIDEYLSFKKNNPASCVVKSLQCIECGDEIDLADGEKRTYFKHHRSKEGHDYCSLYQKGTSSKRPEAILRKKLSKEVDISLNLELRFSHGQWSYLITIPPFKENELDDYEKNKVKISIFTSKNGTLISNYPVNRENFMPNRLKLIPLQFLFREIYFKVTSEKKEPMCYRMHGYDPEKQLFKTLINQEYVSKENKSSKIDLSKVSSFARKRVSGNIYLGKHYIFLSDQEVNPSLLGDDAKITKLIIGQKIASRHDIYDIVFQKKTKATEEFCNQRDCILNDCPEAKVIWPPRRSVDDYRYAERKNSTIFLVYSESNISPLNLLKINNTLDTLFKIDNHFSSPFYVTSRDSTPNTLDLAKEMKDFTPEFRSQYRCYLYKNETLIRSLEDEKYSLSFGDKILNFKTRKSWKIIAKGTQREEDESFSNQNFLNRIRYTWNTMLVSEEEIKKFRSFYTDNSIVKDYLDSCEEDGRYRKTEAYLLLKRGIKNGI